MLAAELRQAEGCKLAAYQDSLGVWTIGYGTNLQALTISLSQAELWLVQHLDTAETEAEGFTFYAGLTSARQRAIVELVYNLGLPKLLLFTKFLSAMTHGDYVTARAELLDSRWATQVGPTRSTRIANAILHG